MDGELPRWEIPPRVHPLPRMCKEAQAWQLCGRSRVVANMGVAYASAGSRGGVGGPHRSKERASARILGDSAGSRSAARQRRLPLLLGAGKTRNFTSTPCFTEMHDGRRFRRHGHRKTKYGTVCTAAPPPQARMHASPPLNPAHSRRPCAQPHNTGQQGGPGQLVQLGAHTGPARAPWPGMPCRHLPHTPPILYTPAAAAATRLRQPGFWI